MVSIQSSDLLQSLDTTVEHCRNFFQPDFSSKIKRFLGEPVKTTLRKLNSVVLRRKFVFPVSTKTFFGYAMRTLSSEGDLWNCGILKLHPSETALTKYLLRKISPGEIFLDIGAHHGFYTMLAHKLISGKGEIHSFEPARRHFKILLQNCRNRKNIFPNNVALHSNEQELNFYEHTRGSSTINTNIFRNIAYYQKPTTFENTRVQATTLDLYCKKKNIQPTFIKIDVEGAEHQVLVGGVDTLQKYTPIISLEVLRSPFDYQGHLRAIKLLKDLGYKAQRIGTDGHATPIPEILPDRDIDPARQFENFIFEKR